MGTYFGCFLAQRRRIPIYADYIGEIRALDNPSAMRNPAGLAQIRPLLASRPAHTNGEYTPSTRTGPSQKD
ncbi:MAG: hypothetical protein DRP65_04895 [Planctomycetota bacterium]|nr:MAG: hypothetical protein DRP65_04895 [Planctomycetota bacterium]